MKNKIKSRPKPSRAPIRGQKTDDRALSRDGKGQARSFPVVGIGASAGGYESFALLLEALPLDSGMAFVLIQHLDPNHESKLAMLLSRLTRLPVLEVTKSIPVKPNHIYLISPNKALILQRGRLISSARSKVEMPPMPIDHFLRSLAEDCGPNGIGVILSGNGSDGTLGMEAINAAGGMTFAQEPGTASFPSMPQSAIASGCVDFVLPPAQISGELTRIPRHPYLAQSDHTLESSQTPVPLAKIFSLVRAFSGVDFTHYKQSTIKRRILRRMVVHRLDQIEDYLRHLQRHPEESKELFDDMLITVTRFFRDPKLLQVMTQKVFPALVEGRRPNSAIRIWVPGCSSGEEVYSIAICLAEFLSAQRVEIPMQVFGTDINEGAIAKARAGSYPANIAQDVPPDRLRRYFTQTEEGYRINKAIREKCVFARQNLIADPPFSELDLITCQNVLIYFGPELQRQIIPAFHYALRPHGFLVLGSAESIGNFSELFQQMDRKHRLYAKTPLSASSRLTFRTRVRTHEPTENAPAPEVAPPPNILPIIEKAADRVLLQQFTPPGVIVDSQMQILQFRGHTAPYLEHNAGTASLSLLKMTPHELSLALRSATAKALQHHRPVQKEITLTHQKGPERKVKVEVVPFKVPPSKEQFLLVLFFDLSSPSLATRQPKGLKRRPSIRREEESESAHLREELDSTQSTLQGIIEELEASNEELKSANEEIQSANEELQSTNEELETAKEELQSTNEELSTVNDELQHTNQQANLVNNDLINLLANVQIPVVMVDNNLILRRFTPSAQRFFNLIPTDIGRSLSDIKVNVNVEDLEERIHGVIETLHLHECEVQDRQGHWYSLRIRPYRTKDNRIEGAVLALLDIDALRRNLDEMSAIVWEPLVAMDADLKVIKANDVFYEKFELEREQVEGKVLFQLSKGRWDIPELRDLLEKILPEHKQVRGVELEYEFPKIGRRRLQLHARRFQPAEQEKEIILLALQDVTEQTLKPRTSQ